MLWTMAPTRKQKNFSELTCTGTKVDLLIKCFGNVWEHVRFYGIFHLYLKPNYVTRILVGNKWSILHRRFVTGKKRDSKSKLWLPCGHHGAGSPAAQWNSVCMSLLTQRFNSDRASTQRRNKTDTVAVKGQERDIQFCTGIPKTGEKNFHYFNQSTVLMQRMVKDIKTLL